RYDKAVIVIPWAGGAEAVPAEKATRDIRPRRRPEAKWQGVAVAPRGAYQDAPRCSPADQAKQTMRRRQHGRRPDQHARAAAQPAVAKVASQMADGIEWKARGVGLLHAVVGRADDRVIGLLDKRIQPFTRQGVRDGHQPSLSLSTADLDIAAA